jgi:hypothetical protein
MGAAIGVVVAGAVVSGLSPNTTVHLLSGAMFGLLPGLFVYRSAQQRRRERLAQAALIGCVMAGAMMGLLLAIPTALAFYVVIRRTPITALPGNPE